MGNETLYKRLGGYDAIAAVVSDLLPRLRGDPQLAHYWQYRSEDNLKRSKQLLIDFLCSNAGGPVYYTGRDMKTSHKGMKISQPDWAAFMGHLQSTLEHFQIAQTDRDDLIVFIQGTKVELVEA